MSKAYWQLAKLQLKASFDRYKTVSKNERAIEHLSLEQVL